MLKTDSSEKPSQRFATILLSSLEKEGFVFHKSKNEFVQEFEYGKRIMSLSFISTAGIISNIQVYYIIIFTELEKQFKKIFPKYGWTNWTITCNLNWTKNWLYDKDSKGYTDKSINLAASEFFEKIIPQIDSMRDRFKDYSSLNSEYNKEPIDFFDLAGRIEKHIINGLILVKWFQPDDYERPKAAYRKHFESYNGQDKEEVRLKIEHGINYLDTNELFFNPTHGFVSGK